MRYTKNIIYQFLEKRGNYMALSDYKKFKEAYQKQGYMKAVSELEPKEPEKKPTKPLKDILKQIEPKKPTYDFTKTPEQNLIEQFKATAPIQPQKTPAQRLIEEPITRRAEISEAVSETPVGKMKSFSQKPEYQHQ